MTTNVLQMKIKEKIAIFWFRRDLRLEDNSGLYHALKSGYPVLPIFIFDTDILDKLEDKSDKRVDFTIQKLNNNALANVLRVLVSNNEEWVDGTYMVKSEDILNIATELEAL